MKNNEEKMTRLIDEAYKGYVNYWGNPIDPISYELYGNHTNADCFHKDKRLYSQEEFINKIKTDVYFAKMWGLKIEERELSHDERIILMNKKLGVTDTLPQYYNTDDEMDKNNVPTKLITVTYNNETIEIYE
jgi:hypothetical protein